MSDHHQTDDPDVWKGHRLHDDDSDWRCPWCDRPPGTPICAIAMAWRTVCILPVNPGDPAT